MGRIPRNGDFLTHDDIATIYEAYEEHQKNFQDTPPPISLVWVLMNIGSRYAGFVCIEQEWTGTLEDIPLTDGDPKCPNGHPLKRGAPLRLSWSQKEMEVVEERDDSCDVWVRIDFGHGPVEIRCTQLGPHREHGCVIQFSTKGT